MIDLKKYDGRYVEIMYGPQKIIGKLSVGEETKIENAYVAEGEDTQRLSAHCYLHHYIGRGFLDPGFFRWYRSVLLNERNINTLVDITEEFYHCILECERIELSHLMKEKDQCEDRLRRNEVQLKEYEMQLEGYKKVLTSRHSELEKWKKWKKMMNEVASREPLLSEPVARFYTWLRWGGKRKELEELEATEPLIEDLDKRIYETKIEIEEIKREKSYWEREIEKFEKLKEIKKDIEQILEKKKEEKPKRRLSFIYSP